MVRVRVRVLGCRASYCRRRCAHSLVCPGPWVCTAALKAETTISEMIDLRLGEIHNLPKDRKPINARTGI